MPLVNLTTNLKSLRYGSDRRDQGSSNQPYVTTPIPNGEGPGLGDVDFLLRGGSLLPSSVVNDVSRLTQMMFDLKSPNGVLFSVKQNALSRSGVNIKAQGVSNSKVGSPNRLPLNNGIYLPTSTLAQAAVNPLGGHLLKQGINPFASTNDIANDNSLSTGFGGLLPLAQPIYLNTRAQNERQKSNEPGTSRLIQFLDNKVLSNDGDQTNLYSYSGGPGSTLGVGKTNILMSKDRTGLNNPQLKDSGFFSTGKTPDTNFGFDYSIFKGGTKSPNYKKSFRGGTYFGDLKSSSTKSVTGRYATQTSTSLNDLLGTLDGNTPTIKTTNDDFDGEKISTVGQSVYQTKGDKGFQPNSPSVKGLKDTLDYDQLMVAGNSGSVDNTILQDFRQNTPNKDLKPKSIDYTDRNQRLDGRVNQGSPGLTSTDANPRTSYVAGRGKALDKINALQIYKSENIDPKKDINDLCKFRIGVIDNDNPDLKTYIHFRAFIDSMDDNYTADWGAQTFTGRAENLYNYQGFDRSVNLSWTVAAQSKQELIPMYQKLNYLASVCAPDYSSNGYMRGNLIELTVGGYLYNQVGIMKGISYGVPTESPWEIGINDSSIQGEGFSDKRSDPSVKELPFIIKVSGFNFTPIHNFVPNVQKNVFAETKNAGQKGEYTPGDLDVFGPERYISLSNGFNNNYTTKLDKNNNNVPENIGQ